MLWSASKVSDPLVTRRLQETALQAERDLRLALEGQLRAYHALLENLVHRLGLAAELDALRHDDPSAPKGWGPMQWQQFFENALARAEKDAPSGWGSDNTQEEVAALQKRLAELEGELERARQERDTWRTEFYKLKRQVGDQPPAPTTPTTRPPDHPTTTTTQGKTVKATTPTAPTTPTTATTTTTSTTLASPVYRTWAQMMADLKLPSRTAVPIAFRDLLPARKTAYKRHAQVLFAVGVLGLSIRPEMDLLIASVNGLKPRSGSVRRIFAAMLEAGILETETLALKSPATRLALVRLTEKGRYLAEALFGKAAVESEWERLQRLHEGDRFPEHTLAVLLFALHARLRGWEVEVMPHVKSATPPDVAAARDGRRLFVEVELGRKDRGAKWKHNAEVNGGMVALCTGTAQRRALLVGDCRAQGLRGVATDLESMIGIPWVKITPETPLWLEEWQ